MAGDHQRRSPPTLTAARETSRSPACESDSRWTAAACARTVPLTIDEAVEAAALQLHPDTRRKASTAMRAAALREELEWAVEDATTDLDFARDYQRHMPHPGTTAADYLNRWVNVSPASRCFLDHGTEHETCHDRSSPSRLHRDAFDART